MFHVSSPTIFRGFSLYLFLFFSIFFLSLLTSIFYVSADAAIKRLRKAARKILHFSSTYSLYLLPSLFSFFSLFSLFMLLCFHLDRLDHEKLRKRYARCDDQADEIAKSIIITYVQKLRLSSPFLHTQILLRSSSLVNQENCFLFSLSRFSYNFFKKFKKCILVPFWSVKWHPSTFSRQFLNGFDFFVV